MAGKQTEINSAARRLREILLGYLKASGCVATWPGGDGLSIEDVLDAYPEAVARGKVPDWQQLLCRHPEVGAELHVWMAANDRWNFAVPRDPPDPTSKAGQNNTEAQGEEGDTYALLPVCVLKKIRR
jgi:hypothetical protein